MKKIFSAFSLFLFLFFIPTGIGRTFAAVTPCDPVTGVPCTFCITEGSGCRVDFNESSCNISGYSPDPSVCSKLSGFCNDGHPSGNCLAAPVCDTNGSSCTGTSGTQGSCCNGLICNGTCGAPAVCKSLTESCPGPAGTQGGCCNGLICQVTAGGGLRCQNPPNPITGYFCETSGFQCLPCHSGDLNSGCNPPQYSDFNSCHLVCTGQVPIKFNCDSSQGGCVEAQNGQYDDIAACEANCSASNADLWCKENETLNTAIGCIPILTTKEDFLSFVLKWAVGIGGGIAFLLIVYAGFMIMTSAGNPERLKAGQELLTSAISGLILLIFSVVILKIIGVDILRLCKFGFGTPC